MVLLQERGPLPGPESGLLSNTRKWIVWGDTGANEAGDFTGKGRRAESRRVREPGKTALPCGSTQSRAYGDGSVSRLSLASHSDWVFPGGACLVQPRWILSRRILGGGWTPFDLSWTLPVGGGLLVLCSSSGPPVKTTHANGYYGAWPGPAVSVNVHPLTVLLYCVGWVWHPCRRWTSRLSPVCGWYNLVKTTALLDT